MVAETQVQYICEENLNAPTLPNTWGSLIEILDTALVNGLNLPAINTVVIDGSVILINFTTPHQLKMFQIVSLSGFVPAELNKKWRIIGVPLPQQIAIDRLDSINVITTVGQARLPPLGYEKTFSATGKGVYRNANEDAEHRPFLRVDATLPAGWTSTYAKFARVALMTSCVGIDDITSQYQLPFDANNPEKNWTVTGSGSSATLCWSKWLWCGLLKVAGSPNFDFADGGSAGNRKWMIVGDENAFYLVVQDQLGKTTPNNQSVYGFGVYNSTDNTVQYPYFLASNAIQGVVSTTYDSAMIANSMPFCGSYEQDGSWNYRDCTNIYTLSNTGETVSANTYFAKHISAGVSGNVTAPHYIQVSGQLKGEIPHIYIPYSGFGTTYNNTKLINDAMFITTPVFYRQDKVIPSWGQYNKTIGLPFYLGGL